jgi:hypothetical protein
LDNLPPHPSHPGRICSVLVLWFCGRKNIKDNKKNMALLHFEIKIVI